MMLSNKGFRRALVATCGAVALACGAGHAVAQQARTQTYAITQQDLGAALRAFALNSGRDVVFDPALVRGKVTAGARGDLSEEEALRRLLDGTGLSFSRTDSGGFIIRAASAPVMTDAVSTVGDVIVTANKRSERLVDVPMSVVALGAAVLEDRNVASMLDVVRLAPGLAVQDQGPGQRRVFMRGVGNVFGNSSLVGLYLDESSVNSIQDAEIDLRPYDLERVEVLRGPQGTLYGEGATAGAIRFITNAPDLSGPGGMVKDSLSFTKGGELSNNLTLALNLPVNDQLGFRVAGEVLHSGGWIDQPAQGRKDINDQTLMNLRLSGLYRPTDAMDVRLTGIIHRNDAGAQNTVTDRSNTFIQVLGQTTTPSSKDEYDFANATVNYDFGPVQLVSSTTYMDVLKNLYDQGSSAPISPPPAPELEVYGDRFRQAEVFSQEVRLSSTRDRLSWLAGFYYRDVSSEYAQDLQAGFGTPIMAFATGFSSRSKAASVFGNVDYDLTDAITFGGGLRFFRDKRTTSADGASQSGTFEALSPRLYVRYNFAPDANIYASVAKGFRSGGFNSAGQSNYGPERAWTYELGTKVNAYDGRISAELSVYHTDYTDVQVYTITDFTTLAARYTNAGDAKVNGIEASITYYPTDMLELGFSGSYTDSEFTSIRPGSTQAVGDSLDYIPEYNALVWAGYEFPFVGDRRATARMDYSLQGASTYRNRTVGDYYFSTSDVIRLLNASVETQFGPWRAEIFGSNLLNDQGFRDAASINSDATINRPRTFGVTLSRDF